MSCCNGHAEIYRCDGVCHLCLAEENKELREENKGFQDVILTLHNENEDLRGLIFQARAAAQTILHTTKTRED